VVSLVRSRATVRDARSVVDAVGAAATASPAKVVAKAAAADQQVARRRPERACELPVSACDKHERGAISARGSRAPMEAT